MTNMENKLNITVVNTDKLKQLCKDRLDFGFDSIYFRYAEAIDELVLYKVKEYSNINDKDYLTRWANNKKMHFYNILEQLTHAHINEEND